MKHIKKPLTLLFLWGAAASVSIAQKIDTGPLDAYWKLTEPLKHGDSLSVKDWNAFLKIEANQIYIENQGFDSAYLERERKTIQYVYMPQYDTLLQRRLAAIKKSPDSYWLTYKVYQYRAYEDALKNYERQITTPAYLDSIYKNAFQWLPERLQKRDTSVTIHLLGIENDAIAGDGIIIFTGWTAFCQDRLKMGILGGHEMHHVLRKGVDFKNVTQSDQGIIYVLNSILNEGTADMVDKRYELRHLDALPEEYNFQEFLFGRADTILKQIDSSVMELTRSKGKVFKTEKEYRNIIKYSSGHCPGYFMADVIVRNGFKRQLIENIQNPFYFVYLYNKAAKRDQKKPAAFSALSIAYIQLLEKKYWQVH